MGYLKLLPQLLAWTALVLVLLRALPARRAPATWGAAAGCALGVAGMAALLGPRAGELPYNLLKSLLGAGFLLLCAVSVAALYANAAQRDQEGSRLARLLDTAGCAAGLGLIPGLLMGVILAAQAGSGATLPLLAALAAAGAALALAARALEPRVPARLTVSLPGMSAALMALLLFSSASQLRLDLFSPLSMKVMKFTHDFVHQFFESMLIPDHLFIRQSLWGYIGFLFGKEVGFWGGMIIWFAPAVAVLAAVRLERLPAVAHIRQGAQRRRMLAAAIRARRWRLVVPALALVLLACAVYRSRFPSVEYWDPKPIPVAADPSGAIFIPRKGSEVDLEDGKLHKYLYKKGGVEARFFVLMNGNTGKLTVDLDACAICKPDGYGQAEGTVLCYYCNTLIPLDTVGKPGGCNPVPVPFTESEDGVHLDAVTLIGTWSGTVQSTTGKGGGK